MTNRRVMVTGSTGFVGAYLSRELLRRGVYLRGVCRTPKSDLDFTNSSFSVPSIDGETDWRDAWTGGVEVVVHLAARVHFMSESASNVLEQYRKVNVHGTLHLARQAVNNGVRRFVFVSSVKVNGESTVAGEFFRECDEPAPKDPYGISKMEAEQGLRHLASATDMEVVIIRPPLVYGPGVKANFAALMRVVQLGLPLPLGAIHNQRSLVALANLVDFIITCTTHSAAANQTFLISDGQDLSTTDLVRGMARAAAVPARLLAVPVPILRLAARIFGKTETIDRLCSNLQIDSSKARNLLGWAPPVSVEEGLRQVVF